MLIVDFDDMGFNNKISDQCRTRDCRKELEELKEVNPNLKVTLFTVPEYLSPEIEHWASKNDWVELAVHGWNHHSNYECSEWTEEQMREVLTMPLIEQHFVKVFRAPGWQISDDCYKVLKEMDYIVADQPYNDDRRPDMRVYKIGGQSVHGHTWSCCGNGIDEKFGEYVDKIKDETDFRFISEVV